MWQRRAPTSFERSCGGLGETWAHLRPHRRYLPLTDHAGHSTEVLLAGTLVRQSGAETPDGTARGRLDPLLYIPRDLLELHPHLPAGVDEPREALPGLRSS